MDQYFYFRKPDSDPHRSGSALKSIKMESLRVVDAHNEMWRLKVETWRPVASGRRLHYFDE
jgi:hypothetical protein